MLPQNSGLILSIDLTASYKTKENMPFKSEALRFAPSFSKSIHSNLARATEASFTNGRKAFEFMVKRIEEDFGDLRQSIEEGVANPK